MFQLSKRKTFPQHRNHIFWTVKLFSRDLTAEKFQHKSQQTLNGLQLHSYPIKTIHYHFKQILCSYANIQDVNLCEQHTFCKAQGNKKSIWWSDL